MVLLFLLFLSLLSLFLSSQSSINQSSLLVCMLRRMWEDGADKSCT